MELPLTYGERISQLEVQLKNMFTLYCELKDKLARNQTQLEQIAEENRQLQECHIGAKKDEYSRIFAEELQLRRVNFYRSFFSGENFMGSIQQAMGYWAYASAQPSAGAELVNRFVMLYGSRLNNDITILRSKLGDYMAHADEQIRLELQLAFPEEPQPELRDIDVKVAEKQRSLDILKEDPNTLLYNALWQHVEPLLAGVETDGLESLLAEDVEVAKAQISRLLTGVQSVFEQQGILVCYSPDALPRELQPEADDLFMPTDALSKQRPLIMRLRDHYIYTRGFNCQKTE